MSTQSRQITRTIWNDTENMLLIYVGVAAEFALHPENHWLFYTNKLPSDPQARFVETLAFQQRLVSSTPRELELSGHALREIHTRVENRKSRTGGTWRIPNQAFLDLFYMFIDYGIRGYEYIHRHSLDRAKKEEYLGDIGRIAKAMNVKDFPENFTDYLIERNYLISRRLAPNRYTNQLFSSLQGSPEFHVQLRSTRCQPETRPEIKPVFCACLPLLPVHKVRRSSQYCSSDIPGKTYCRRPPAIKERGR